MTLLDELSRIVEKWRNDGLLTFTYPHDYWFDGSGFTVFLQPYSQWDDVESSAYLIPHAWYLQIIKRDVAAIKRVQVLIWNAKESRASIYVHGDEGFLPALLLEVSALPPLWWEPNAGAQNAVQA